MLFTVHFQLVVKERKHQSCLAQLFLMVKQGQNQHKRSFTTSLKSKKKVLFLLYLKILPCDMIYIVMKLRIIIVLLGLLLSFIIII